MQEFILPDFLKNKSIEEIHKKMLALLPENIDKSQGQHVYNLTRPTALVVSELCQQTLPNILRLIFPMWAYGEWLDYHAQLRGITRRTATAASGSVVVTGKPPFSIPMGTEFSTASINGESSVFYRSIKDVFSENETATVEVKCVKSGKIGNVMEHTIIFLSSQNKNIKSVDNILPITGGTEIESDENLRERILEYDALKNISYVGSAADYKRWSKEVDGVGEATVISAQDDSGLITVVITDSNGEPANKNLCDAVYNHIMSPDDPELRFTPPNVRLLVIPPECISISISAVIEPESSFNLEQIKENFFLSLKKYFSICRSDGEIRWTQIGKLLAEIDGVYDYKNLFLNGETNNIYLNSVQLPQIDIKNISLSLGAVS